MPETLFGTVGRIDELNLTGKTELQFIAEALADRGFTLDDIRERFPEVDASYIKEIERFASNWGSFHILPGARDVLEAISTHPRYYSSLHSLR